MANTPEDFFRSLPPVTRAWFVASLLATLLTEFRFFSAWKLFWIPEMLLHPHWEVWRLVTPFVYMGRFGLGLVINLIMILQFSGPYESNPFSTTLGAYRGGTADYVFALMVCSAVILVLGTAFELPVAGPSLISAALYLWSKRNPENPINIWGFRILGRHLPWARLALALLMGDSPLIDGIGIFAAHVYYFLVDVLPVRYPERRFLTTPEWLIHAVDYVADTNTYFRVPQRPAGPGAAPAPGARAAVIPPRGPTHSWGAGRRLGAE